MTTIRLEPWEREWAGHVGTKVHEANLGRPDAKHYDPARMDDNLTRAVAAACAELAVAKRLNKYWSGSYWTANQHHRYRDRPDVGENTEVRHIRRSRNPLPVRAHDVEQGRIMVLAYPVPDEFVTVEVIGYGLAAELWELGVPAAYDPDGTTRLVPQGMLNAL